MGPNSDFLGFGGTRTWNCHRNMAESGADGARFRLTPARPWLPCASDSSLAQSVEQAAVNRRVPGSSPGAGATQSGTQIMACRTNQQTRQRRDGSKRTYRGRNYPEASTSPSKTSSSLNVTLANPRALITSRITSMVLTPAGIKSPRSDASWSMMMAPSWSFRLTQLATRRGLLRFRPSRQRILQATNSTSTFRAAAAVRGLT